MTCRIGPYIPPIQEDDSCCGGCEHEKRFENKGILTCQNCSATYNESTLEWEERRD